MTTYDQLPEIIDDFLNGWPKGGPETTDEMVTLLRKRRASITALATPDGQPMVYTDGRTIAFEFAVIELLMEIRSLLAKGAPSG